MFYAAAHVRFVGIGRWRLVKRRRRGDLRNVAAQVGGGAAGGGAAARVARSGQRLQMERNLQAEEGGTELCPQPQKENAKRHDLRRRPYNTLQRVLVITVNRTMTYDL